MLYIIGLGLNVDGISKYAFDVVKRCKRIYLENYTVDFPYTQSELSEVLDKKLIPANRDFIEGLSIIDEAKKLDVALLVYGSPLTATTHITLIDEAKKSGLRYKIIYNASVFDAIAETGLQLYKFGKIASMPAWKKSYEPDSFMEIVKDNQSINAHSLILVDIGLDFPDAIEQLKKAADNHKIKLPSKLLICQSLGTKHRKIMYKPLKEAEGYSGVKKPYCIIIPSKLHFVEKDFLKDFE